MSELIAARSGVILIDKPSGFTSFDVIAVLRGVLRERRLGHTGTLDPMATGVLPVLVGKATRAADILPENEKSYRAGFALGYSTDTLDVTGEVVKRSGKTASREELLAALDSFRGVITQLPPMYSAVQVGGRRLYDLARQGVSVERTPRRVEVYSAELIGFDQSAQSGELEISCSKGTYIRSIIDDLGELLGTGGVMTALTRTSSQGFGLSECVTLDEIKRMPDPWTRLIPTDSLFERYPELSLSRKQERMYKSGVRLDPDRVKGALREGIYRVYGESGNFLGLCRVKSPEDGQPREMEVYKNFW